MGDTNTNGAGQLPTDVGEESSQAEVVDILSVIAESFDMIGLNNSTNWTQPDVDWNGTVDVDATTMMEEDTTQQVIDMGNNYDWFIQNREDYEMTNFYFKVRQNLTSRKTKSAIVEPPREIFKNLYDSCYSLKS